MAADSTEAGYITPASTPAPVLDTPLDRALHDIVQLTTGISDPKLVRPRWQPEPPQPPPLETPWVAFGLTRVERDTFAAVFQEEEGQRLHRTSLLSYTLSFYGPTAHAMAEMFSDGIEMEQNRAGLHAVGADLEETQPAVAVPALLHERWTRRVDVVVVLAQRRERLYPVLPLLSADVNLDNEVYTTQITVSQ